MTFSNSSSTDPLKPLVSGPPGRHPTRPDTVSGAGFDDGTPHLNRAGALRHGHPEIGPSGPSKQD